MRGKMCRNSLLSLLILSLFSSLSAQERQLTESEVWLLEHGLARCGTPDAIERAAMFGSTPGDGSTGADCDQFSTNPDMVYDPGPTYVIQVVFHVIIDSDGTTGDIPDSCVERQIEILNEDFNAIAGTNGQFGTDGQIQFVLATEDPMGNPTNGITRSTNGTWFNDGGSYWNTLAWDPNTYMNIYSNTAGGNLGYVPFLPADSNGGFVGGLSDRVVLLHTSIGDCATLPQYNLGRTGTHEVGHFLGLEHTFSGGCASGTMPGCYTSGDLICDTNSEQTSHFGTCPGGPSGMSCGSLDPEDNYMDYSDDICMNKFTGEQMRRMRCSLENWRPNLYSMATNCDGSDLEITADETSVRTCEGVGIALGTNTSGGAGGYSYSWSPTTGLNDPAIAMPTATPDATTTYTVTVTDDDGCEAEAMVTVVVTPDSDEYLPNWQDPLNYAATYDVNMDGVIDAIDIIILKDLCIP